MKTRSLMVGLGILVLTGALTCTDAYANDFSRRSNHKGGGEELDGKLMMKTHVILKHAEELGLGDDKVEAIKSLELDTRKMLIRQKAEIEVLDLDIRSKLHAASVDVEAVDKLVDQKYELKKAETKNLVAAYAKLKGLLTSEQFDQLSEFWKHSKGEGKGEREEGNGWGDREGRGGPDEHSRRP